MATTRTRLAGWLVVAVAVATAALAVATSGPGSSPLRVIGSTPGDGATLPAAPGEVAVFFEGLHDPVQFHLVVAPDDGRAAPQQPAARIDADRLVLSIDLDRPGGYVAAYHVVLVDGQQAAGLIRFAVLAPGEEAPPSAESQSAVDPVGAGHDHGGGDPMGGVLLVVDVVLIVGLVVAVVRRSRLPRGGRQPNAPIAVDPDSHPEFANAQADRGHH